MTIAKPPVEDFATDFDHTDPQWVENPYPIWEDLQQRCPVAHTNRYGGAWFPTTHELVSAVANDTEHFTSRSVVMGQMGLRGPMGHSRHGRTLGLRNDTSYRH